MRPHYLIVVDRKKNLDDLEVRVEVDEELFSDVMGDMVRFQRKVAERMQAELGLRARVTLVEPGANEKTAGATRASWTCGRQTEKKWRERRGSNPRPPA